MATINSNIDINVSQAFYSGKVITLDNCNVAAGTYTKGQIVDVTLFQAVGAGTARKAICLQDITTTGGSSPITCIVSGEVLSNIWETITDAEKEELAEAQIFVKEVL